MATLSALFRIAEDMHEYVGGYSGRDPQAQQLIHTWRIGVSRAAEGLQREGIRRGREADKRKREADDAPADTKRLKAGAGGPNLQPLIDAWSLQVQKCADPKQREPDTAQGAEIKTLALQKKDLTIALRWRTEQCDKLVRAHEQQAAEIEKLKAEAAKADSLREQCKALERRLHQAQHSSVGDWLGGGDNLLPHFQATCKKVAEDGWAIEPKTIADYGNTHDQKLAAIVFDFKN